MKKIVIKKGNILRIYFPFNTETINEVKKLTGRKWNPSSKYWYCPAYVDNLERLKELGFNFNFDITPFFKPFEEGVKIDKSIFPKEIFPYQIEGVKFIESRKGRCLVGDDMGLGKTLQALMYLKLHPELRPAVIVCPASLKYNWRNEIKYWLNNNSWVIDGKFRSSRSKTYLTAIDYSDIIIINYDLLDSWVNYLSSLKPQICIVDEIHYCKNSKTIRTKAVKKLSKICPHFIALTGTPIVNRPIEFFNILNMIDPNRWPSYWNYAQRYCNPKHNGFGWTFNGASNTEELNEKIQVNMIRRKKEDVLKELPPKIRTVIPIEIDYEKYSVTEAQIAKNIGESKNTAEQLTRFEILKQLAVSLKLESVIKWIEDYLESENKLVIFCTHHSVIDRLAGYFEGIAVKLDGRDSQEFREISVKSFQNNDKIKLFIGNIKAAGVGLTLTAASATCFIELGWTPGEHEQAEDRVHRIGQEASSVNAYYLLAENTIETEIAELLDSKRKVLDSVLDGKESEESSLLTELIKRYKNDQNNSK